MKIALIQSELTWGNVKENLEHFDARIAECGVCDVIVLPEMFTSGCMMVKCEPTVVEAEKKRLASYYEDVKMQMSRWAKRQSALIMGSTVCEEEGLYYNRLVIAYPDGSFGWYDKRHCFLMGGESDHFVGGNRRLIFEYQGVKMAVFICYDLRFPVWCRNVEGYEVAVFVANWPETRREIWRTLIRARAIENQAFVVGVNCVGMDNNGIRYAGDSMVVDARGEIVKSCRDFRNETLITDINIEGLRIFRQQFPVLDDRDKFTIGGCGI